MLDNTERALVYMATLGKETIVTIDDFCTILDLTSNQVRSLLASLVQKDWVKRVGVGQYVLTNLGTQRILNSLKPKRRDTHKTNPEEVRVWTIDDVLKYMVEKEKPVTCRELYENLFLSSLQDANTRLNKLKKWNLIKEGKLIIVGRLNKKVKTYVVTNWGKEYWQGKKEKRKAN